MSSTTDSTELQFLIQRFQNYKSHHLLQAKSAAVLVCIYQEQREEENELRVILTKRSSTLSSHPGEVALPGGKRDEEDSDDTATALREAREEIGLDPCLVTIVSVLEPFVTKDKNRIAEEREYEGQRYLLHYFDYYSEDKERTFTIWALTAGILIRVASIVYQRSPEFQELKPSFWNQPN